MSPDEYESYVKKLEQKLENAEYALLTLQKENKVLEDKVLKLKRLILLVDDSVYKEQMNQLSLKQWNEFIKDFPEEE